METKNLLDLLPEISWTWIFGANWDTIVVLGGVVLLGVIVWQWIKANKRK